MNVECEDATTSDRDSPHQATEASVSSVASPSSIDSPETVPQELRRRKVGGEPVKEAATDVDDVACDEPSVSEKKTDEIEETHNCESVLEKPDVFAQLEETDNSWHYLMIAGAIALGAVGVAMFGKAFWR